MKRTSRKRTRPSEPVPNLFSASANSVPYPQIYSFDRHTIRRISLLAAICKITAITLLERLAKHARQKSFGQTFCPGFSSRVNMERKCRHSPGVNGKAVRPFIPTAKVARVGQKVIICPHDIVQRLRNCTRALSLSLPLHFVTSILLDRPWLILRNIMLHFRRGTNFTMMPGVNYAGGACCRNFHVTVVNL